MQVPRELASAHDLHTPLQAAVQQTPWAQMFDRHSMLLLQDAPGFFFPHELPLQTLGGTQFLSWVQASKHLVLLQANGAHDRDGGAAQAPLASQADGPVYTLPVQASPAQAVPGLYLRQAPPPLQRPSVPQLAAPVSLQTLRVSSAPSGRLVQRPFDDGSEQLRQAPPQAESQQTPSTQKLEAHSGLAAQG